MMKKDKKIILWVLLVIGTYIVSCSSDISQDKPTPTEDKERFEIPVSNLHIRDPFIIADTKTSMYYLHCNDNLKFKVYKSKDLQTWKEVGYSFIPQSDFWGKQDFWAPDIYYYNGKYYLFATFSNVGVKRGTSILVSETPTGPFVPYTNGAITPSKWACLDGSLYIDEENNPWLIFCHEWLETIDGEIYAQKLSKDLKTTVGEPSLLFSASEAGWTGPISSSGVTGYVTDAPFIYRLDNGNLIMLWSSFKKEDGKYAIGQSISTSGNILGPWIHEKTPLNNDDGGHAMVFKDFKGRLMISYHSPNSKTESPKIVPIYIKDGKFTPLN